MLDLKTLLISNNANVAVMTYADCKYSLTQYSNLGILIDDELLRLFNESEIKYNYKGGFRSRLELTQNGVTYMCNCSDADISEDKADFSSIRVIG